MSNSINHIPYTGGEQFTDIEDRGCILEVLKYSEQQHALPTKHIHNRLIEAWECSGNVPVNHVQDAIEGCMDTIDGCLL